MLILFDNGTPRGLARLLIGHTVEEARLHGWEELANEVKKTTIAENYPAPEHNEEERQLRIDKPSREKMRDANRAHIPSNAP